MKAVRADSYKPPRKKKKRKRGEGKKKEKGRIGMRVLVDLRARVEDVVPEVHAAYSNYRTLPPAPRHNHSRLFRKEGKGIRRAPRDLIPDTILTGRPWANFTLAYLH